MFDANKVKDECVAWIKDWFEKNGPDSPAILGISGGKDSCVVAALCKEALGADRVVAVLMPNGEQSDEEDQWAVINHLGLTQVVYANIKNAYNALVQDIQEFWTLKDGAPEPLWTDVRTGLPAGHISPRMKLQQLRWNEQGLTNLPARLRMATLYAVSATYNGRVANTCNRSEDIVGYATLYGDSAGDFSPLSKLTVQEVKAIGKALGLPDNLVDKTPSDGLCGKSDEDALGFTYEELDDFIRNGKDAKTPKAIQSVILEMYVKRGKFKLDLINLPSFDPGIEEKWKFVELNIPSIYTKEGIKTK